MESGTQMNRTLEAGQTGISEKFPIVGTASVDLKLVEVQPAGKRVMRGCDFLNGARNWADQGIK
jgi:methionyl-tRNA formyltransferase